ncbi:hypothetical protein A5750_07215 [Mycobacterium sp. 852002-51613_SCH5001154]|uniref:hypothetical protein n=1 Tax=Mycobacterium sp. 852002-51613_SCH5001154 TaxID=1834104 RepID=UPI0007FEF43C|nr:hypothetical protein [Mycobacterium sp. 852002-51613_SCH5001154]OBF77183.1 hypothetical protein A5750_07215 [Mycobacterium sp. 852002-51613_SCH5001154]
MGRKVAIPWHASFSIAAGVLYFFFVLPRWPELMGDTTHSLGTALRIATGALFALAALPVVFNLLRVRKPELGTPQLALTLRVASIVAHVLAGVLIIGTAISEIWLNLDTAGRYLFAIYGAAAAIGLLGFFAFYLSFVAELPPPPPKPIKAKKPKKSRSRRKAGEEDGEPADEAETEEADAGEPAETEAVKAETAEEPAETEAVEAETAEEPAQEAEATDATEPKLRNRRPTGKGSHRMRRRRTRGGVAVEEALDEE